LVFVKKKIAVVVLAAFALSAVLAPVAAFAQDTASASPAKGQMVQIFLEKLAANLGVDKSKLVDALKQTALQVVDEAAQQGRLTPDLAQKIKERIEQGRVFPPGTFRGPKGAPLAGGRLDLLAQALGMSTDKLKAELEQGKKVQDIAQEKGITPEQLRQKLQELRRQTVQQMVNDGGTFRGKVGGLSQRQGARRGRGFMYFGSPAFGGQA